MSPVTNGVGKKYDSPLFGKSPIEDIGVRDISNLKGKLTAVAKSSSSSTFRKFLTVRPTLSLPYTRFTRLIRRPCAKVDIHFQGTKPRIFYEQLIRKEMG